ncbi:MAG: UDP-N-acetylmuramoyl-tripeptide--D-alanyl-D-alanine ligase [Bacilli bacterium]|nr:UDP-N-acetylmuramoyl-tripeptide--D-alanyl-D-alanine ligase [Bacilli bacterium]
MTLNEIINIVNGISNIDSNETINNIKTDTRNIDKGDIFVALKGKNYNGEDFIDEALEKGAIACIVEKSINNKCIEVKDTIESLFLLGRYIRKKYNIPLIAITGSNGKTTTKDLLYHILTSKYNVLKNDGNKNNIIGVSNTLFNLNNNYEIIVMELGSNHIGEISYLSKMCKPNVSIITNIGSSHLEYFKNRKNIFKEKVSIIDGMINKKLILNGDDKYLKKIYGFKCGINKKNDLKAYNIKEYIDHITFNIYLDKEYEITFNNPGIHFINNILLAIKVALDYNIKIETIINRIKSFKLTNKRMNIIKLNNNILINDCYNSSLESIIGGINYLKNIKEKKVLIIGDILELGKHSKRIHKKINKEIKKLKNKEVYTVGKHSKYIGGINFKNIESLIEYIKLKEINNSYIYVKGSRRMNLDKVVEFLINKKSII